VVEKMRPLVSRLKKKYGMPREIEAAFLTVDRANFTPNKDKAYQDTLDKSLFKVSWLLGVLKVVEVAVKKEGSRCLVMGSGTGYEAALLSELAGERGRVVAQEPNDSYVNVVKQNLRAENPRYLQSGRIIPLVVADIDTPCGHHAPYNAIIDKYPARALNHQFLRVLAPNGIIVYCSYYDRSTGQTTWTVFRKLPSGAMEDINCSIPSCF
jgi:protein-L-isoaspartate(D-aspartate) O-methyltransferase